MNKHKMKPASIMPMLRRMLVRAWKQNHIIFLYFIIYTLTATIYPLLTVALPKWLIPQLLVPQPSIRNILWVLLGYFAVMAFLGIVKSCSRNTAYPMISVLRLDYLGDMMNKLSTMDYEHTEDATFFDRNEMAFQAFSSNNNGIEGIYHEMFLLPALLLTVFILSITVSSLSPWVVAGLLFHVLVLAYTKNKAQIFQYSKKSEVGHASRRKQYYYTTTHDFGYGKDIRIFQLKNLIMNNYVEEIRKYLCVQKVIFQKSYVLGLFTLLSLLASNVLIYGTLIQQSLQGMNIADFSMYLTAILAASQLMQECTEKLTSIVKEAPYVRDFYELIETNLMSTGGNLGPILNDTLKIEFRDVSFRYPNTENYIFRNLNLTIEKGQRVAIVGINGAGKTTLVKLMVGLFPVTEGVILINDIPLSEYSKEALYQMFSVVFQDVNILAYTIRENVACKSEDVDDDKVKEALRQVGLLDKVMNYEKGLDQTLLKVIDENGTEMSGGESQKLSIARALYKNANMVIMDEPTAALDALAEAEIYENFSTLIQGKTALYISHRLASTKFCDVIALFDRDGLVELGNHEELMKLKGKYYGMFTIQGKYYQETEEIVHG